MRFAGPRRSKRADSRSCSVLGIAGHILEHRPGQLLDKEGNAVGPAHDPVHDLGRKATITSDPLNECRCVTAVQPGECDRDDVRKVGPSGRTPAGGYDQQDR